MITIRQVAERSMTEEKRKAAKNDFFAYYIGRPLSYALTIPFLYTDIKPNTVTILSYIPQLIGFLIFCIAKSPVWVLIGWVMFFLWNLLDGVDGNIARYKKEFSLMGSVHDAASGYMACTLTFFGMGFVAAHFPGFITSTLGMDPELLIALGGLSGIFTMFPRLVMHKAKTTHPEMEIGEELTDKAHFSPLRILALNLKSTTGGAQFLMLVAILAGISDLYTLCYFLFNLLLMLVSLRSVLKEK